MPTQLLDKKMHFQYELISLSAIDYQLLLNASDPREKMLAILGDFKGQSPAEITENIARQIIETSNGDFAEQRYLNQLSILMRLRNLATMDSIAPYITLETDMFYLYGEKKGLEKGLEKGLAKGKKTLVKNLLRKTDFSIAKIADIAEVTEYFVKKVKRSLR